METRAASAIRLLKQVLSGAIAPEVALEEWPSIDDEDDELLVASWHDLSHFAADADIRIKDRPYADYQTQLLARRVQEITEKFRID